MTASHKCGRKLPELARPRIAEASSSSASSASVSSASASGGGGEGVPSAVDELIVAPPVAVPPAPRLEIGSLRVGRDPVAPADRIMRTAGGSGPSQPISRSSSLGAVVRVTESDPDRATVAGSKQAPSPAAPGFFRKRHASLLGASYETGSSDSIPPWPYPSILISPIPEFDDQRSGLDDKKPDDSFGTGY